LVQKSKQGLASNYMGKLKQTNTMRNFKITIGKQVKGFNFYSLHVPNLRKGTSERVYFIQAPFLNIALFMGYKTKIS
jgi:hypothetical protein